MNSQSWRIGLAVVFAGAVVLAAAPACAGQAKSATTSTAAASSSTTSAATVQLERWSRALRDKNSTAAYTSLSAFALRRGAGELGQRAALALGYFDYSKGNFGKAQTWLEQASHDLLIGDYAMYWSAAADHAIKRDADAVAKLEKLREKYPDSVMTEQALEMLGDAAIAASQPQAVLDALSAYPATDSKPALILARGEAREAIGQLNAAAGDYLAVFYHFPLSGQSHEAGVKADLLRTKLGADFPVTALDIRIVRAEALYAAHEWYETRDDYTQLLGSLGGADRDHAEVRIAQSGVGLGASLSALANLTVSDPDADAERLYWIASADRTQQKETDMLAAVEGAASRAPASRWTEQALFMVGNYFWVQLDRDRAASYYARVDNNFPGSTDAPAANWRVAWRAYLEHRPETLQLLELHLERYPSSPFITDDLYWLARVSETAGNANAARAYYQKLIDRYPRTYFGGLAVGRLKNLGPGDVEPLNSLSKIPPLAPARPVGPIPEAAAARQSRANALRTIAFDSSAELELRAAYAATGEPRLLLEAAQAAADAGHYGIAISTARQVIPSLESRRFDDVPREVWKAAYPLPYEKQLRDAAGRAVLDPMVVAGLIRQESAYETNAISHANAYGLMQLLPKTARLLARQERVGYSRPRLTDPGYNLRLGTVYLAGLVKFWGSFEAALAAYNAGEDRVGSWRSGQSYAEPAEFVDSIPFTETREYVQIVLRNAETYRTLYGHATPAGNTKSSEGHK
jgi:soluble lytic murein transglycosylase